MTNQRQEIKAVGIASGICLGQAWIVDPRVPGVDEAVVPAARIGREIEELDRAVAETIDELRLLRESAGRRIGGPVAKIFDAQLLIAGDSEFLDQVKQEIRARRRNAAFIYQSLVQQAIMTLKDSTDGYLRQMASDIDAVATKVISHLAGVRKAAEANHPANSILVSHRFTPGDILLHRQRKAIGFIVEEGGRNSHAALIARSSLTPAVVIPDARRKIAPGSSVIVDATGGRVIVNPSDEEWSEYQKLRRRQGPALISRIKRLVQMPPLTADAEPVTVAANLEIPGPADEILSSKRIPIGLYRTEFLFLERAGFPDEETQYEVYRRIAEQFSGSYVVLRTYDLGADKAMANGEMVREDNPALGWRGLRLMLGLPDVFKAQVRAMLRASTDKNVRILLPMVSDISELEQAHLLIDEAKAELKAKQQPWDPDIQVGIMIEVPSAALTADELVSRTDFVAIGTNDLTQYTMSADRNNHRVANLYSVKQPSVLKLIKMTVDACVSRDKPISICGEAAGDLSMVPLFLGMGVRFLSMNPAKIVDASRLIKKVDCRTASRLVEIVMSASTVAEVNSRLDGFRADL